MDVASSGEYQEIEASVDPELNTTTMKKVLEDWFKENQDFIFESDEFEELARKSNVDNWDLQSCELEESKDSSFFNV